MTNFDYIQKTVDIFEDSLGTDSPYTTAGALAAKIGYSQHHLGRLFYSLCGDNLGRYILKRRLAEAARAIREGDLKPGEAAGRFGWEDYSAFSRAVRKEFKVSPAALKTLNAQDVPLATRARPRASITGETPLPDPEVCITEGFHATGPVFFMGTNEKGFHKPWRIFTANRGFIRGVIDERTWQFSSWDEHASPEDDGIWIHCAVKTDPAEIQDMRFFSREIPAMSVLSFRHEGPIELIHDTYRKIFRDYLPASAFRLAGNMEFQRYSPDGTVEICLPVSL